MKNTIYYRDGHYEARCDCVGNSGNNSGGSTEGGGGDNEVLVSPEEPTDSRVEIWVDTDENPSSLPLDEAPSDGKLYARKDKTWSNISNQLVTNTEKDLWNSKLDKLVSGTNIATINNQDITKGGDIIINGGTTNYNDITNKPSIEGVELKGDKTASQLGLLEISVTKGVEPTDPKVKIWVNTEDNTPSYVDKTKANVVQEKGTSTTDVMSQDAVTKELAQLENSIGKAIDHGVGDTTFELTPNDLHVWGEVASLNLTLAAPTENREYKFQFSSGTQPTTLSLPSEIKWIGSDAIEANKTYQVSILNNLAVRGGM